MAMKALQTKLRDSEAENEALRQTLQDLEERYLAEKERLQEQLIVVQAQHDEKELEATVRGEELQADLDKLTVKLKELYDRQGLLEEQKSQLEAEAKLTELKSASAKSYFQQQIADLQADAEKSSQKIKQYKTEFARLTSENARLASSLKHSNDLVKSLQEELSIGQETAERTQVSLQENILHMESELNKLNSDYVKTVSSLEDKNYEFNERHREDAVTIEQLKQEIESLKIAVSAEEEARMSLLKKMSDYPVLEVRTHDDYRHARRPVPESKLSEKQDFDALSPYLVAKESYRRPQQREESENLDLTANIAKLETEIAELKKMYRRALKRSYTEEADMSTLKGELNSYTKELEAKNMLLYKLKRMWHAGEGARAAQLLSQ